MKRTLNMPGGAGKVTQRRYGPVNLHTYGGKVAAGRHIRAETLVSAAGHQVRVPHKKAAILGGSAIIAGGGLYVGHKWHQHNVRQNSDHINTKMPR